MVSYESIREWGVRFGRVFAAALRHRRPRPGDKWHLDEVFIRIRGKIQYLWRAVDQEGNVLDTLVQSRRNAKAAKRFFRKLLKGLRYAPRGHCQLNGPGPPSVETNGQRPHQTFCWTHVSCRQTRNILARTRR